jgi:hypothetical protein
MRPIILILILYLQIPLQLYGQYFVVKVVDKVYMDDQLLEQRSKLSEDTQLRFSSPNAFVHVISPSKGEFILSGKKAKKNKKGEFFIALKNAIIPYDQFLAAATRGTEEELIFEDHLDLKAFFRGKLCLLDSLSIRVHSDNYPIGDEGAFSLVHEVKRKRVSHVLPAKDQQLLLTPEMKLDRKGKDISDKIRKSYLEYTNHHDNIESFGPFQIHFLSPEDSASLKDELAFIHELVQTNNDLEFIQQYATPFITNYYGFMPVPHVQALVEGFTNLK